MRRVTLAPLALALTIACKGPSAASAGGALDTSVSFPLTSADFAAGAAMPKALTCDGANESPALAWQGAPAATKGFLLVADDPDAPSGDFTHWVLFDVPAMATSLAHGSPGAGVAGKNDFGNAGYGGPCPPPGKPHRYFFRLYALDVASLGAGTIALGAGAARGDVEAAAQGHVLAKGEILGTYGR
jgi:Raf kinase inhibitor-like YbhB/YbcL family protein